MKHTNMILRFELKQRNVGKHRFVLGCEVVVIEQARVDWVSVHRLEIILSQS